MIRNISSPIKNQSSINKNNFVTLNDYNLIKDFIDKDKINTRYFMSTISPGKGRLSNELLNQVIKKFENKIVSITDINKIKIIFQDIENLKNDICDRYNQDIYEKIINVFTEKIKPSLFKSTIEKVNEEKKSPEKFTSELSKSVTLKNPVENNTTSIEVNNKLQESTIKKVNEEKKSPEKFTSELSKSVTLKNPVENNTTSIEVNNKLQESTIEKVNKEKKSSEKSTLELSKSVTSKNSPEVIKNLGMILFLSDDAFYKKQIKLNTFVEGKTTSSFDNFTFKFKRISDHTGAENLKKIFKIESWKYDVEMIFQKSSKNDSVKLYLRNDGHLEHTLNYTSELILTSNSTLYLDNTYIGYVSV